MIDFSKLPIQKRVSRDVPGTTETLLATSGPLATHGAAYRVIAAGLAFLVVRDAARGFALVSEKDARAVKPSPTDAAGYAKLAHGGISHRTMRAAREAALALATAGK